MIPSIDTHYAGHRFRSRLEARWAVFLDRLRLPWQYEHQGYVVDGKPYLPDFWLPTRDTYLEIKGRAPTASELLDCQGLAAVLDCRVVLAAGDIPHRVDDYGVPKDRRDWMLVWDRDSEDDRYVWCYCPRCGCPGIEFEGRSERINCEHHTPPGETGQCLGAPLHNKTYTGRDDLILAAYDAARSARFEHGESGAPVLPLPWQRRRDDSDDPAVDVRREPKRLGDLLEPVMTRLGIGRSPEDPADAAEETSA